MLSDTSGLVLVIDGNPGRRRVTRAVLERAGFRAREAGNEEQAIAMVQTSPPDLILLSLSLPDSDGYTVTRRLRRDHRFADLPIILVAEKEEGRMRSLEAGADDLLVQPMEAELLARVRTLLRLQQSRRALVTEKTKIELLYRIGQELSAELDLDILLGRMLERTLEALRAYTSSIVLFQEEGRPLRRISLHREGVVSVSEEVWSRVMEEGLAGWVIRNRRGVVLADTLQDPRWIIAEEAHAEMRSALAVPLIHAGRVSGMLTLTHQEIGYFTTDHLDLLNSIASQAALAIENARAFHAAQVRARQLHLVNEVGRQATSILDPDRLLKEVVRLILQAFDYYCVLIALREGDAVVCNRWGVVRGSENWVPPIRIRLSEQGIVPWVAAHGEPLLATDVSQEPRYLFAPGIPHTVAELAVPLRIGGEVLGVLDVQSDRPGHIREEDVPLLETLASQVAIALRNAQLYTETEAERRKLAAILSATADAVIVTDEEGRIMLINSAAQQALDLSEEHIGQPLEEAVSNPALLTLFRHGIEGILPFVAEIPLDSGRTLYSSIARVEGAGCVAVMQDVTHFKELDREKSEFVATVSHDLRSPLGAIRGYAEVLRNSLIGEEREYAERIEIRTREMAELIGDLLDLGRIEMGVEARREPIRFDQVVDDVVEEARLQARRQRVELAATIAPITQPVIGDPYQIRRALENLVGNAIKYTPAGGTVTVRAWENGERVLVEVEDTGIGIPRDALPRVFEKFYRVPSPQVEEQPGTGLGLAIVKVIVDRHNGQVWVESEPGKGSVFGFSLPVLVRDVGDKMYGSKRR